MGAAASKLGWEDTDAKGNRRSAFNQFLDPIGACLQPASFNLYDPGEHLDESPIPDADADPIMLDDAPQSPLPPPPAM